LRDAYCATMLRTRRLPDKVSNAAYCLPQRPMLASEFFEKDI
jgi:hypothetical protein